VTPVRLLAVAVLGGVFATSCVDGTAGARAARPTASTAPHAAPATVGSTVPPPVNVYAGIGPAHLSPAVASDPPRVYVPDGGVDRVSVIDPSTDRVVATIRAGRQPQHIVPSWDLRTLWVLDNSGNDVFPIDPATARAGRRIHVDDPYNLYFTPDGSSAIVVAEARRRLDFRDPHTMALQSSLAVPGCRGINHADYSADESYLLVTCEFAGSIAKIDMVHRRVVGLLRLGDPMGPGSGAATSSTVPSAVSMPQDVRAAPDGHHFYVADMAAGGVHVIDGDTFTAIGFIPTGIGAHGITPARDGRTFYIANRGAAGLTGAPNGPGSVSVLDTATDRITATWPVPGGGSPDMGNLSADGTRLWLSGRFDSVVYAFDTASGRLVARIPVGDGPHGLTVWPQPGAYSLGHTGNMR
jgi:YVTN family beta-propeller protein